MSIDRLAPMLLGAVVSTLFYIVSTPAWPEDALSSTQALVKNTSDFGDVAEADDGGQAGRGDAHNKKPQRDGMLGDASGVRPYFERYGVTFDVSEISEGLVNPTGGLRQRGAYDGLLSAALGVDLEKALGVHGATLNVSLFQPHGGAGLSTNTIGNFNGVSDVENKRANGLYEAWVQQAFGTALDVRAGRLSADEEFMVIDDADVFMNEGFGWPTLPSKDLLNGGPIPAEGGVRARAKLNDSWEALAGLYRGSQADAHGADVATSPGPIGLDNGLFAIGEVTYSTGKGTGELAATYKVGGWYRSGAATLTSASPYGALQTLPETVRRDYSL